MPEASRYSCASRRARLMIGVLAAGLAACSAPPPMPSVPEGELSGVALPREADARDLVLPQGESAATPPALPGDWRFRPLALAGGMGYVPYVMTRGATRYVPYYATYDPDYYYLPAYSAPSFGGGMVLLRLARR